MDFTDIIQSKRPTLSKSSLKTYNSILKSLYKGIWGKTNIINVENFDDVNDVLKYLNDLEPSSRKTILSALVVITDKKEYRDKMLDDIKNYNKNISKQEKNEKQVENWIDTEEIMKIYKSLEKNAKLLYKKELLTTHDIQQIQNYVILSVLGGMYIPPRRSKDYVDFKIKNINKEKDNYLDKNKLVFHSYKTAKTYGKQEVIIPKELKAILVKWIKLNPFCEYLFFDTNDEKLSNVKLNQRLNKILGRKASVNQLRHTFLSDKYNDMIDSKKELDSDVKMMGTSINQFETYVKK